MRADMTLPLFEPEAIAEPTAKLRPYQERTIRLLRMHVDQGKHRILCVAPTRSGKMFIAANIIRSSSLPVIFVAHRMELIDQCVNELARVGITNLGVIRGQDERSNPSASIQVASIQTLARRDKPFQGQKALIIIDEAHRSIADSYVENIFEVYKDSIIIGFTATPCRLDGAPLGKSYQVLEVVTTYGELLKRKDWLVAPDIYAPELANVDLSKIKTIAGDYDEGALAEVMKRDDIEGSVVGHWMIYANRHPVYNTKGDRIPQKFVEGEYRRTFLFACNIAHSLELCARFEKLGIKIAHLDGKTPEVERRRVLRAIAAGELQIISNCNILLEGVDVPSVKCVSHVRPTKSITLWRQSSCRCLTPWNNIKPLILDHAGNIDSLGPPHEDIAWSLTEKPKRHSAIRQASRVCPFCYAYIAVNLYFCPHCGAEMPKAQTTTPSETDGELQLRNTEPDAVKADFFMKQVVVARTRGLKPGFASVKFKERYGQWPPRDWSERVKSDYEQDEAWKFTLSERLRRKEEEKEADIKEQFRRGRERQDGVTQAVDAAIESAIDTFPYDNEETLGDWLEQEGIV